MNKLIVIGYMSMKKCYLNIDKEDAIERYLKSEEMTREDFDEQDIMCEVVEFETEFEAYDIWEPTRYVIEITNSTKPCWVANHEPGDPPRTLVIDSAQTFGSRNDAKDRIKEVKLSHPLKKMQYKITSL